MMLSPLNEEPGTIPPDSNFNKPENRAVAAAPAPTAAIRFQGKGIDFSALAMLPAVPSAVDAATLVVAAAMLDADLAAFAATSVAAVAAETPALTFFAASKD